MELVFVEAEDLELIDLGAEALWEEGLRPVHESSARAFVLTHRSQDRETSFRIVDRAVFVELRRQRWQGSLADALAEMARILGLEGPPAAIVTRDAEPAEEAVVMAAGQVIGAWVEVPSEPPPMRFLKERRLRLDDVAMETPFDAPADAEPPPPPPLFSARGMRGGGAPEPREEDLIERVDLEPEEKELPVAEEVIRRTPHMDVPADPVEGGQDFRVEVFVDAAEARPGEEAEELVIAAPRDQTHFEVLVWLVPSDHFEVKGEPLATLTVERAVESSQPIGFDVSVKSSAQKIAGTPSLSAVFLYQGRPAGKVTREIAVAGLVPPPPRDGGDADGNGSGPGDFELQSLADGPDVTVVISSSGVGQSYRCVVTSTEIPGFFPGVEKDWGMREGAEKMVAERMKLFAAEDVCAKQRRSRLVGAGRALFEKTPDNFQDAIVALEEDGEARRTILIVTEEAAMPWELLIPDRPESAADPLGVRHVIGRWTHPKSRPTLQTFALECSRVVAPNYEAEGRQLTWAPKETEFVCEKLSGKRIDPATFGHLDEKLGDDTPSLVHFICHGAAGGAVGESIWLDDDKVLNSEELRGMEGVLKACQVGRPIVFMNACEVARGVPSLIGAEGFARSFIAMGARAVIAPLWRVKDELAHETATAFYKAALKESDRPFADIIREIRTKTYEGDAAEDTYAAYCFYGDPRLRLGARP